MVMTPYYSTAFDDQRQSFEILRTGLVVRRLALVAAVALCTCRCQQRQIPVLAEVRDTADQAELPIVGEFERAVDTQGTESLAEAESEEVLDAIDAKMCKSKGKIPLDCGLSATEIDVVLPYEPTPIGGQNLVCLKVTGVGFPMYKVSLKGQVGCENISQPEWIIFAFGGCVEGVKTGTEFNICVRALGTGPLAAPLYCKLSYSVSASINGATCSGQFSVSAHYP